MAALLPIWDPTAGSGSVIVLTEPGKLRRAKRTEDSEVCGTLSCGRFRYRTCQVQLRATKKV